MEITAKTGARTPGLSDRGTISLAYLCQTRASPTLTRLLHKPNLHGKQLSYHCQGDLLHARGAVHLRLRHHPLPRGRGVLVPWRQKELLGKEECGQRSLCECVLRAWYLPLVANDQHEVPAGDYSLLPLSHRVNSSQESVVFCRPDPEPSPPTWPVEDGGGEALA
jgi:hypothetical protein